MMIHTLMIRPSHLFTNAINQFLLVGLIFGSVSTPAFAQRKLTVSSGVIDNNVALGIKIEGIKYNKGSSLSINYRVENTNDFDIYLVVGEKVNPSYDPRKSRLWASINKVILNYHSFDFPKLQRLKPRQSYQVNVELSLEFLKSDYRTGTWFLYLSIGYLDNKGMNEIRDLLKEYKPSGLVREFERLQMELSAGPIEIELIGDE